MPARVARRPRGRRRARPDEARRVPRRRRLRGAREGAGDGARRRSIEELHASNLRGRGGAFFPTGRKASFIPKRRDSEAELPRRQRRRVGAGHVQGPRDHAPRPAPVDRGLPDHGARDRVEARLHLHPRRVPRRVRGPARRARGGRARPTCSAASRSSSTAAPARTSAARRRRCSSRSRASAASRARSRRSRRSPASTRRRRSINNVETIATVPPIIELGGAEYAKIGVRPNSTGTPRLLALRQRRATAATTSCRTGRRCAS